MAVIGHHAVSPSELAAAAARIGTVGDVNPFVESLVGSAHVAVSVDGQVRVQGTVASLRHVIHASVRGVRVASDRADVLAAAAGAPLDGQRLAVHLLDSQALHR